MSTVQRITPCSAFMLIPSLSTHKDFLNLGLREKENYNTHRVAIPHYYQGRRQKCSTTGLLKVRNVATVLLMQRHCRMRIMNFFRVLLQLQGRKHCALRWKYKEAWSQKDKTHRRQCKILSSKKLIEGNAKFCRLKILTCKGTWEGFICLRPPLILSICLGRSSNIVGSESNKIQSVKILQNMVSNRTPYPSPPPYTPYTYIHYTVILIHTGGGRGQS